MVFLNLEGRKSKGLRELMLIERVFGYKARVNRMFLNISRWLEIIEREHNELLLSVKNSNELGYSPRYTSSVVRRGRWG